MATQKIDVRFPVFRERFCTLRGDMTQDEFAKKLGFSRPTIGLYESGSRIPDALVLRTIAEKCGVSADWLVGLSSAKTANITTQGICKETGLSEEAVFNLCHCYTDSPITVQEIINSLVCDFSFMDDVWISLSDALESIRPENPNEETTAAIDLARSNGYVLLAGVEAKELFLDNAVSVIREILSSMLDRLSKQEANDGEHQEN